MIEEKRKDASISTSPQDNSSSDSSSDRKTKLPVTAKKILKFFRDWLKEHRAELSETLLSLKEACSNVKELKEKVG